MELMRLFLNTSWKSMILAALAGLFSGVSSAGLIALSNITLNGTNLPNGFLAGGFFLFCLSLLISTAISQMCISRLAERIIFDLRLRLTQYGSVKPQSQLNWSFAL